MRRAYYMVLVFLLIGVVVAAGCTDSTQYSQTGTASKESCSLKILSHTLKHDEYGTYWVEGIAQNTGDKRLSYAEVRVRFYDSDGTLLDTSIDNTNDLDPGMKWRFKVYYFGDGTPAKYDIGVGTCWES